MAPYARSSLALVTLGIGGLALPGASAGQTVVREAAPVRVLLEAGGAPVDVVLRGGFPEPIRSLLVVRRGREVPGVVAKMGRMSSRELQVRLAAQVDVSDLSGLRLLLVTEREKVEAPVDVAVSAAPPEPVDLAAEPTATEPVSLDVGRFLVTLALPSPAAVPAEPVSLEVGAFAVTLVDPTTLVSPAEPVTVGAGTFTVTLAPPPGGDL